MLLTLYRDEIAPELRERIENEFNVFVREMRQHAMSKTSKHWDKAKQQINKIMTIFINSGRGDIAALFDDPDWILFKSY